MIDPDQYREAVASESIDGITYTSSKFACTAGLRMLTRSTQVLGEYGLKALMAAASKGVDAAAVAAALGPRALVQIASGLESDSSLPRDLLERTKASYLRPGGAAGSVSSAYDAHFQGEYLHLLRVCGFVLAHNFLGPTLGSLSLGGSPTPAETTAATPSEDQTPSEE